MSLKTGVPVLVVALLLRPL